MSDDAIKNAIIRRNEALERIGRLEKTIKRLNAQVTEINKFISQWERFSGRPVPQVVSESDLKNQQNSLEIFSGGNDRSQSRNPKKEDVATAVVQILNASQAPVSRSDLYELLKSQGIVLQGTNPEMVLSTMLWRTRELYGITRLKSGGYTLTDRVGPEHEIDNGEEDEVDILS